MVLFFHKKKMVSSCQICAAGTYSLISSDETSSCLSCSSEFVCPGGSSILLNPGND